MTTDGFHNEPILELRRAPARESLLEALRELDTRLPLEVPVLIGGERGSVEGIDSTDPGAPDRLVARAGEAGEAEVSAALEVAERGFREWSARSAAERAEALRRTAARLREQRLELAALQVRECAKPWPEADADVCEAIDFLEYYALEAVVLERGRELVQVPGERNTMRYAPRGVTAVIAPWNFPLAIACGMTAAALAVGNAALLKPAEQSPGNVLALVEALHASGVPHDALALLPGHGETGATLVRDPRVHVIAFTGSAAVGLEILRVAAETPDGQGHVKRVVSEMGGKNCVIVDADADLDEAVPEIVYSAFGFAGQKCSAAARVLVHEAIADTLAKRLAGAIEVLEVGQAADFASEVPPVIDREAQERVLRYREVAGDAVAASCAAGARRGLVRGALARRRAPRGVGGQPRGDLRAAALTHHGSRHRRSPGGDPFPALRADRWPVLAQPGHRGTRVGALARGEPLCQPGDHRRDGRPSALRGQPALGRRVEGRRPGLPVAVRRAAGRHREHHAPWNLGGGRRLRFRT